MKKLLIIFCGLFVILQTAWGADYGAKPVSGDITLIDCKVSNSRAESYNVKRLIPEQPDVPSSCYTNVLTKRDNEFLYIGRSQRNAYAFTAASAKCPDMINVCILGDSISDRTSKTDTCWQADVPRGWTGNLWKVSGIQFSKCTGGNWNNLKDAERIPVFVNQENKILKCKTTIGETDYYDYLPNFVGYDTDLNSNIKCIGYVCPGGTYGCHDGTCSDTCSGDAAPADPDESDDDGKGSGGAIFPSGGSSIPSTPSTPSVTEVNRKTIQPYLDVLKSKCSGIKTK